MRTTVRKLTPPLWSLIAFAAVLTKLLLLERWLRGQGFGEYDPHLASLRQVACSTGAAAFAIWRVGGFHPAVRTEYRSWLRTTPWQASQPLPAGSVRLTWFDALFVVALTALALDVGGDVDLRPVLAFVGTFAIGTATALLITGQELDPFLILLCGAVVVGLARFPWLQAGAVVVLLGLVDRGLSRSLREFRGWCDRVKLIGSTREMQLSPRGTAINPATLPNLGWPYQALREESVCYNQFARFAIASVILFAAYFVAFFVVVPDDIRREILDTGVLLALIFSFAVPLVAILLAAYRMAPPVSLLGSLRRGRIFRRGYDELPVLGAIVAAVMPVFVLTPIPFLPEVARVPIAVGINVFALLDLARLAARNRLVGTGRFRALRSSREYVSA